MIITISSYQEIVLVQWADDTMPVFTDHMCINHGRSQIGMAQQVLNRSYIISVFEQMRRKAVPKGMNGDPLRNIGPFSSSFDCSLDISGINVMAPQDSRIWVN